MFWRLQLQGALALASVPTARLGRDDRTVLCTEHALTRCACGSWVSATHGAVDRACAHALCRRSRVSATRGAAAAPALLLFREAWQPPVNPGTCLISVFRKLSWCHAPLSIEKKIRATPGRVLTMCEARSFAAGVPG